MASTRQDRLYDNKRAGSYDQLFIEQEKLNKNLLPVRER